MRVLLLLALLTVPALASEVSGWTSFRCPPTGNLLSLGDTTYAVRTRCRPPDDAFATVETRTITRTVSTSDTQYGEDRVSTADASETVEEYVQVPVEVWTFDFGRNRFLRVLRFESGRLVSITHGDRGAAEPQ